MCKQTHRGVRSCKWLILTGLISAIPTVFAADAHYQFEQKAPRVLVHGVITPDCLDTAWAAPNSASADSATGRLTLSAPKIPQSSDCSPEYFAFSPDRALVRLENTNRGQDKFTGPLKQLYTLGIKFHALNVGPANDADKQAVLTHIDNYVAKAHAIFAEKGVGIKLSINNSTSWDVEATKVQDAINLIPKVGGNVVAPDVLLQKLKDLSPDAYTLGQINVYLLNGNQFTGSGTVASSFKGFLAKKSPYSQDDYIVINWDKAKNSTFAHELGHALSLGHVNFWYAGVMYCYAYNLNTLDGICDYKKANLMWIDSADPRNHLTGAQVIRTVFNENSFLNRIDRFGGAPASVITCPDSSISHRCPFLASP